MTANYYTQEDAPPDISAQVLSIEQALAQADPATAQHLLDDAGAWLGTLYTDAEARQDNATLTAITESWQRMNAIKMMADTGINTAKAAVAGMRTALQQRDEIATELSDLAEAVESADTDHPLVSDLIDRVHDEAYDNGLPVDCPGCAACEQFPVDHDDVNYFIMTLLFDAEDLSDALKQECASFISTWSAKARAEEAVAGGYES